ncbi:MAG: pentapeptide repeat-containing protein [Gloeomargarita sp. GMQP_bins_120]
MVGVNQDFKQELLACQQRQATGTLHVQAGGQRWWLYFFLGRLLYATGGSHRVRRWYRSLKAHCPQFQPDWSALEATQPWEYWALVQGTKQGRLTPAQAKAVIWNSVLEVLFTILAQDQVTYRFQAGQGLGSQIALLQVERVLEEVAQLQHQWQAAGWGQLQHVAKHLSPDLAPIACRPDSIPDQQWVAWLRGQQTLWDLVGLTRKSVLQTVGPIVRWVQQGWVELQVIPDLPAPVQESSSVRTPDNPDQPLIACLDDSPVMLKVVEGTLARAGYRVMTLAEPMTQMAALLEAKPDVILMDWVMPHVNGYELCALLRKTSTFRDTPIFLITAHEGIVNRTRARLAGVTEILKKPLNPEELLQLVGRYAPLHRPMTREVGIPLEPIPAVPPDPEQVEDHLEDPDVQARQLLERYAAGERDFSGMRLVGCNLQGANLEGINLCRAELMLANLSGCLLTGAKLTGANLMGAELVKTNLREANLSGANLIGANLSQANLSNAQLVNSNLSSANFSQSRLRGANLSEALAAGANFTGADLWQTNLYATNLHGAVLHRANLERANLTGANLWQAQMEQTHLEGANLTGAVLPQVVDT